MRKSQLAGFLLTLFFGPIGLFYSSVPAALGFIVAAIAFGVISGGIGAVLVWIISVIVGFSTVSGYNTKMEIEEKRHRELLEATKAEKRSEQ